MKASDLKVGDEFLFVGDGMTRWHKVTSIEKIAGLFNEESLLVHGTPLGKPIFAQVFDMEDEIVANENPIPQKD